MEEEEAVRDRVNQIESYISTEIFNFFQASDVFGELYATDSWLSVHYLYRHYVSDVGFISKLNCFSTL